VRATRDHIRFGVGLEYINVAPYWRLAAVVFHAGQPDVGYVIPVGKPQEKKTFSMSIWMVFML